MWSPWCGEHQLYVLGVDERPQFPSEVHKTLIFIDSTPKAPSVFVTLEAPKVNELMQIAGIACKVA
jgi:hypothetical protein